MSYIDRSGDGSDVRGTRNAPPWVTWLLIILGVLFVAAGIVYVSRRADALPSFFPGHDAAVHGKHIKHGLGMFGLAVVAWAVAWFTTGHRSPTR